MGDILPMKGSGKLVGKLEIETLEDPQKTGLGVVQNVAFYSFCQYPKSISSFSLVSSGTSFLLIVERNIKLSVREYYFHMVDLLHKRH